MTPRRCDGAISQGDVAAQGRRHRLGFLFGGRLAVTIQLDRSCLLDLHSQELHRSLVTDLAVARASLTPRLANEPAAQSLPSQLNGYGLDFVSYAFTRYFETKVLAKRTYLTQEMCIRIVQHADKKEVQADGERVRLWDRLKGLGAAISVW